MKIRLFKDVVKFAPGDLRYTTYFKGQELVIHRVWYPGMWLPSKKGVGDWTFWMERDLAPAHTFHADEVEVVILEHGIDKPSEMWGSCPFQVEWRA